MVTHVLLPASVRNPALAKVWGKGAWSEGDSFKARSTLEVFEDHLGRRGRGELEEDLALNYAEDVVLLTSFGVFRGHGGIRDCAHRLREQLPGGRFAYRTKLVAGEVAFLEWSAEGPTAAVEDGADSFLIRGGQIAVQTIHYTVKPVAGG